MVAIVLTLALIGVLLYFLEQLPMSPPIKTLIRVVVVICCILYLAQLFGVVDLPAPRPFRH